MSTYGTDPDALSSSVHDLETRVLKVREKLSQWMECMVFSNNAMCELSTAMTDLESRVGHNDDAATMKTTNAALCELSTAMMEYMQAHVKGEGGGRSSEGSVFSGIDAWLEKIGSMKDRVDSVTTLHETYSHYDSKVKRLSRKSIEEKRRKGKPGTAKKRAQAMSRNEDKLRSAKKSYVDRFETVSKDVERQLDHSGEFFIQCFKVVINWLVGYFQSVSRAFGSLGECLEPEGGPGTATCSSILVPLKPGDKGECQACGARLVTAETASSPPQDTGIARDAASMGRGLGAAYGGGGRDLGRGGSGGSSGNFGGSRSRNLEYLDLAWHARPASHRPFYAGFDSGLASGSEDGHLQEIVRSVINSRRGRAGRAGQPGHDGKGGEGGEGGDVPLRASNRGRRRVKRLAGQPRGGLRKAEYHSSSQSSDDGSSASDEGGYDAAGSLPEAGAGPGEAFRGSGLRAAGHGADRRDDEQKGDELGAAGTVAEVPSAAGGGLADEDDRRLGGAAGGGDRVLGLHMFDQKRDGDDDEDDAVTMIVHSSGGWSDGGGDEGAALAAVVRETIMDGNKGASPQGTSPHTSHDYGPSSTGVGSNYDELGLLGYGAFGATHLVRDKRDDQLYVLKKILCHSVEEANDALAEALALSRFESPHIVQFRDFFLESGYHLSRHFSPNKMKHQPRRGQSDVHVCIVMEYMEGGDVQQWIRTRVNSAVGPVSEALLLEWFLQIVEGITHVHSKGLIHRDIKPANLFLSADQSKVKIGDFGISKVLERTRDKAYSKVGTPAYMAPEILGHKSYDTKADMWSLGCVLFELATLSAPNFQLRDLDAVLAAVTDAGYRKDICTLIGSMLQVDPTKRPTIKELLAAIAEISESDDKTG